MNAGLLLVSSVLGAGDDIQQVGWGQHPLPAMHRAGGCGACGPTVASSCCDPCASSHTKLLDRIKGLCAKKASSSCCDPCATNSCGSARYTQPNLLDNLRARSAAKKSSCCAPTGCTPACDPCAAAPAPIPGTVNPNTPTTLPMDMTPAKDPKATDTRKGSTSAAPPPVVVPTPVKLPPLPAAPVTAPKPRG